MPILIDGHNLIGRMSWPSLRDPDDEEQLTRLLQSFQARTGKKVTVVFDPGGAIALSEVRREGGVTVVFASQGSSADRIILQRVRKSQNPRGWLVVTSDGELARQVERLGARVQPADSFARTLMELRSPSSAPDDRPLSPEEVEAWLAIFQDRESGDAMA